MKEILLELRWAGLKIELGTVELVRMGLGVSSVPVNERLVHRACRHSADTVRCKRGSFTRTIRQPEHSPQSQPSVDTLLESTRRLRPHLSRFLILGTDLCVVYDQHSAVFLKAGLCLNVERVWLCDDESLLPLHTHVPTAPLIHAVHQEFANAR